jgi:transposase
MLSIGSHTRAFLAVGATDMRKGFEGLFALVKHRLNGDPLSGHLYVFCNRQRNRLKVLYWDGSGLWVCAKRLEKGRFAWPEAADAQAEAPIALGAAEWSMLIEGIDLTGARRRQWHRINKVAINA